MVAATLRKIGRPDLIPEQNPVAIRFAGSAGTFPPRPVFELFVPTLWKANFHDGVFFKDKIVIVGPEGNFHQDLHPTPLDEAMPGPEIQLNVLNAALHRDFLWETPIHVDLVIIGLAAAMSWLAGVMIRRPGFRVSILTALAAAYLGALWFLYDQKGLLTVSAMPLLVLGSSGLGCILYDMIYDLVRERLEKRKVRDALERYVSRDAVREILDNAESFLNTLGGQRRNITVLFSDIRGFTQLTESADPQVLVAQLTEYFDDMVGLVFAHHGTLDKFIGDAVMAHWGGIVTAGVEMDARRAVTTAWQMRTALVRLNASWKSRGLPELAIGIGVNHGAAIVGSIGCAAKMEISAIGDAINLGSRIEGATKEYGLDLCIGESVAPFVRDAFILRSVDLIVVKGKTKPVEVFTVLAERQPGTPEPAWLARHEEAVRAYRAGFFAASEAAWREVLTTQPGDALATIFLARCADLRAHPPGPDWAGVFKMLGK